MWCLERNINITAQHLPGIQSHIADAESRTMVDRSDWKLNLILFRKIVQYYSPVEVDLFASRLTAQCPIYFSWRPDPYATGTELGREARICEPSMEPGGTSFVSGSDAAGLHCSSGTSVEVR